jgi:creatinine amidohydrolase
VKYAEHNWRGIRDSTAKVAVVPLGSLEQHGHHLPLFTDSLICTEIVHRAQAALDDIALFLPTLWLGASDHHRRFPGTVSASQDTYRRMLVDIVESLISSGFKRILLLNAHGGNVLPGKAALYEVQMGHRDERDLWLVLGTWYELAAPQIAALEQLEQKYISHASELETSMVLRLCPELVDMRAARGTYVPFESAFYVPTSSRASRVTVPRPFEHVSVTGAYGHPERATADKGELLFQTAVAEIVACVREIATWETFVPG